MIAMFLYLSITLFIYVYQPIVSILFILFIFYTKSFKYKSLFIIIFLLFIGRTSINLCQPITSAKVIELNNKSIIVSHGFTNVLIPVIDVNHYALHDTITLYDLKLIEPSYHTYSFKLDDWMKSRNICYKTSEKDTYTVKGRGILNWLSKGGINTNQDFIKRLRSILFQSNPNEELDIFISMGIMYTLIIRFINLCFLKQKNELFEVLCISIIFAYLSIQLAFPLSLIRVWVFYISSHFIKDNILKFSFNLIVCAFINPFGLTQLAFILPLTFQFTALFLPLKSRFIQRTLVILVLLISFNHSISIVNILLYPVLIVIYRFIIVFSIILTIIPFFNPIYLFVIELTNTISQNSHEFFILKGHISPLFILIYLLIYHYTNQYKRIQIIILVLFILVGPYIFSIPYLYTVTMINVGQGDSILIQSPFNQNVILIDTGSIYNYRSLKSYLDAQSIRKIDVLIITHDDSDHSGNIESLTNDFRIKEIIMKGKDINLGYISLNYLNFMQTYNDDNDSSLIYAMNLLNTRFLFMGDLSTKGEYQLIHHYPHLKADILKVGHHGSMTSTSDELLELVQPSVGLISVGKNVYGHPSALVMQKLTDYHIRSMRSIQDGDTRIILTSLVYIIINSKNEFYFANVSN